MKPSVNRLAPGWMYKSGGAHLMSTAPKTCRWHRRRPSFCGRLSSFVALQGVREGMGKIWKDEKKFGWSLPTVEVEWNKYLPNNGRGELCTHRH